jgi:DNA mismatch repair protein MutL
MAGDRLNEEQMKSLIDRMRKENIPFTCPHGRPTLMSIPLTELYRKFDRH